MMCSRILFCCGACASEVTLITPPDVDAFRHYGAVCLRKLLRPQETAALLHAVTCSFSFSVPVIDPHLYSVSLYRTTEPICETGLGYLGWTMAAGSAWLLTDLMSGDSPSINPDLFALARIYSC